MYIAPIPWIKRNKSLTFMPMFHTRALYVDIKAFVCMCACHVGTTIFLTNV